MLGIPVLCRLFFCCARPALTENRGNKQHNFITAKLLKATYIYQGSNFRVVKTTRPATARVVSSPVVGPSLGVVCQPMQRPQNALALGQGGDPDGKQIGVRQVQQVGAADILLFKQFLVIAQAHRCEKANDGLRIPLSDVICTAPSKNLSCQLQ